MKGELTSQGYLTSDSMEGFELIAHHMTINMGSLKPDMKMRVGESVELEVVSFAENDKVKAVGVDTPVETVNRQPHVTVAVNREKGGKPYLSNKLEKWEPIRKTFAITGIITEVPSK